MLPVRGTTICGFVVEMLKLFSEDYVRVVLTKIFFFSVCLTKSSTKSLVLLVKAYHKL